LTYTQYKLPNGKTQNTMNKVKYGDKTYIIGFPKNHASNKITVIKLQLS